MAASAATDALADSLEGLPAAARVGQWLSVLRGGGGDAFMIPDLVTADWWVFGRTSAAYRDLVDAATAFVGVSYAQFDPHVQAAVPPGFEEVAKTFAFSSRFDVSEEYASSVDERLTRLAALWAARPGPAVDRFRGTGRILRELDTAVQDGRVSRANELVADLRRGGRMSSANIAFLELRVLAIAGRWSEILARPDIEDLVRMRLPSRIAATVVEAVFQVNLADFEPEDPSRLVERFKREIEPRFGPAFRDPLQSETAGQRQAWLVYAAALDPPSASIRDAVLAQTPLDAPERAFVSAVAGLIPDGTLPAVRGEEAIEQAVRDGDLVAAWSAAQGDGVETAVRVRALLHLAYEADNPSWAEAAVGEATALLAESPAALGGRTAELHLAELSESLALDGRIIRDWWDWVRTLAVSDLHAPLVATARNHGQTWSVSELMSNPDAPALLLDIATGDPGGALALRQVRPLLLPELLEVFDSGPVAESSALSLLATFAAVIAAEDRIGRDELGAILELAERVLHQGVAREDYESIVGGALSEAWLRVGAPRELGWVADAVMLVAESTDRYPRPRIRFFELLAGSVAAYPYVNEEDREALIEAFTFAGVEVTLAVQVASVASERDRSWGALAGKRVVIYTLVEAAGSRAKEFVLRHVPTAQVEVFSAHDADRRLVEHVRRADVLAIATKAAKHAATVEIERRRRPDAVVVYPTGKGWSSIAGALREAARSLDKS